MFSFVIKVATSLFVEGLGAKIEASFLQLNSIFSSDPFLAKSKKQTNKQIYFNNLVTVTIWPGMHNNH